ncbi:hypothetical protein GDO78_015700 [Eleutherodactylus coqui]|uniref:Uncharacterized protein n=1 Tax=Eleutherodactylus coqui TaxID=57060 RepID=A0A8J6EKY9_ELECQ|nr:hypothetical protein GDO78_015700 [Eleutherodactylus coqui]
MSFHPPLSLLRGSAAPSQCAADPRGCYRQIIPEGTVEDNEPAARLVYGGGAGAVSTRGGLTAEESVHFTAGVCGVRRSRHTVFRLLTSV